MPGLLETARARRAVIVAQAELERLAEAEESEPFTVSDAEDYYDAREGLAELRASANAYALHAILDRPDDAELFAEVALGRHDARLEAIIARAAREVDA